MRCIEIDFISRRHSLYSGFFVSPPEGFTFSEREVVSRRIALAEMSHGKYLADMIQSFASNWIPTNLVAGLIDLRRSAWHHDLVYSSGHVVWRNEPWVTDLEMASHLAGYSNKHLFRYKNLIRDKLTAPNCRGIVTWTQAAKDSLSMTMADSDLDSRIEVVPLAVSQKATVSRTDRSELTVLFATSANFPMDFHNKGGKEVLTAFRNISEYREDMRFIIRSHVPEEFLHLIEKTRNAIHLENPLAPSDLQRIFQKADIFVFPSHVTPGLVLLDAMSYGLPIICTDVWANREMVVDGENGLLLDAPTDIRYEDDCRNPLWVDKEFARTVRTRTFHETVARIEKAVNKLADNPSLRFRLGENGRQMTVDGEFSLGRRNHSLAQILTSAIDHK